MKVMSAIVYHSYTKIYHGIIIVSDGKSLYHNIYFHMGANQDGVCYSEASASVQKYEMHLDRRHYKALFSNVCSNSAPNHFVCVGYIPVAINFIFFHSRSLHSRLWCCYISLCRGDKCSKEVADSCGRLQGAVQKC